LNPAERCPRCGKGRLVTDNNTEETFCGSCGFVMTDRLEESGPEWRSFSKDEHDDRSRTGVPTSLAVHDMGLATIIGPMDKDATGKPLSASMKSTIERLRTWDSRSQVREPVDRNFRQAFSELDRLKDKLTVGDAVIEKSAYIYRKALEKGLVRGRSISVLIASALYVACVLNGESKTQKDVAEAAGITEVTIRNRYKGLKLALKL
ncbi:MAG: TFIIB-type zinc ribbon-containing protein, partial [Nitrosopumilaceae archaeon]